MLSGKFSSYPLLILVLFQHIKTYIYGEDNDPKKTSCQDWFPVCEEWPEDGMFVIQRHARSLLYMKVALRHGRILYQLVCGGYSQTPCKSHVSFLLKWPDECLPQSHPNEQEWVQLCTLKLKTLLCQHSCLLCNNYSRLLNVSGDPTAILKQDCGNNY